MPRTARQAQGGRFHVLNHGNDRDRIFDDDADYVVFEIYTPGKSHDFPVATGSRN